MIRQCSECPNTFETGPGKRSNAAKTCSKTCSDARNTRNARKRAKQWATDNPERNQARAKQWVVANPEKKRENDRQYHKANPEKRRASNQRRKALIGKGVRKVATIDALIARDNLICTWCGKPVDLNKPFEIDHWRPAIHGGTNDLDNLSIIHSACNRSKKDKWPLPPPPWEQGVKEEQLDLFI